MTTGGHLTDEAATEQLMAAWNQMHAQEVEAWNLQAQANLAEQEEQQHTEEQRLRAEDEHQREEEQKELEKKKPKELEKKKPKINDFDNNKMVVDFVMPRPSQFAISKLKSFSFTELWYFTEEGCSKTQESRRTLPEDAYGIT